MAGTILVIDDERNIRTALRMVLEGEGFDVLEASSAEQAVERLDHEAVDLLILDVRLPKMSGIELLSQVRQRPDGKHMPVLMVSGHASVEEAVHAVRLGATDFFEKPLDRDRVVVSVHNALRTSQLTEQVRRLQTDMERRYAMVGDSDAMRQLYEQLEKVAPTKGRVLITGESGTGKELVARALHSLSPRRDGPFIKVNCAAIPAELIESELFGYEKGAFTGAHAKKKGMFELADGGTLFLDEVGDMSLNAQAKVLRALQSGEISRVGGQRPIGVDVRVLAATNKDLEAAVTQGQFREDLFFRLNVIPIRTPTLEERRSDIPMLVRRFLREFCEENGLEEKPIDEEVLNALARRPWPGNVRHLRNVVQRLVILSGARITRENLPDIHPNGSADVPERADSDGRRLSLREYRQQAERRYIVDTLSEAQWNISRAAELLGIERTNLHKKMRAFDIKRDE